MFPMYHNFPLIFRPLSSDAIANPRRLLAESRSRRRYAIIFREEKRQI